MKRKLFLVAIPLALGVPYLLGSRPAPKPAEPSVTVAVDEDVVGTHLLRPGFLPRGMVAGHGDRQGSHRVLSDYGNETETLIIAQEQRSPERDAYNKARLTGRAVDINGNPGSIFRGKLGERRLTVFTPEATLILSSANLSEHELIEVAKSMR